MDVARDSAAEQPIGMAIIGDHGLLPRRDQHHSKDNGRTSAFSAPTATRIFTGRPTSTKTTSKRQ